MSRNARAAWASNRKDFLFEKELAQLIIAFDRDNYLILTWRKRHRLVDVFSDESSDAVVAEFERILDSLATAALNGTLESVFPKEWIGASVWETLRSGGQ